LRNLADDRASVSARRSFFFYHGSASSGAVARSMAIWPDVVN
jgi:hypothetical protein